MLAALTAALWALVEFSGLSWGAALFAGFTPALASGTAVLPGAVPAIVAPLTATLVHAGLLHVGFNVLMLVVTGRAVEPVLGIGRFLLLYVAGAYAAAVAQWAMEPTSAIPMVGASGAISALVAAFALMFGRNRVRHPDPRVARLLGVLWLAAGWIGLQVLFGWFAAASTGVSIATAAHVGGFVAGLVLTPLLLGGHADPRRSP